MTATATGAVLGRSRASDPPTSHEADASMPEPVVAGQQARVVAALAAFGRHGGTAAEITARLNATGRPVQQSVVARRCTDLHRRGLIDWADNGEGEPSTRIGTTGRRLTVWHLTPEGRTTAERSTR